LQAGRKSVSVGSTAIKLRLLRTIDRNETALEAATLNKTAIEAAGETTSLFRSPTDHRKRSVVETKHSLVGAVSTVKAAQSSQPHLEPSVD
jgi:hypothetical protein